MITLTKLKRLPRTFRKWFRERFRSPYIVLVLIDGKRPVWHYAKDEDDAWDWARQYDYDDPAYIYRATLGVPTYCEGYRGESSKMSLKLLARGPMPH